MGILELEATVAHADVIPRTDFDYSNKYKGRLETAKVAGTTLPHEIQFQERKNSWCVIGLNAIISAGGAEWDVKNGRMTLGPPE